MLQPLTWTPQIFLTAQTINKHQKGKEKKQETGENYDNLKRMKNMKKK